MLLPERIVANALCVLLTFHLFYSNSGDRGMEGIQASEEVRIPIDGLDISTQIPVI